MSAFLVNFHQTRAFTLKGVLMKGLFGSLFYFAFSIALMVLCGWLLVNGFNEITKGGNGKQLVSGFVILFVSWLIWEELPQDQD
jgi:positive regulator of sigma E activity